MAELKMLPIMCVCMFLVAVGIAVWFLLAAFDAELYPESYEGAA